MPYIFASWWLGIFSCAKNTRLLNFVVLFKTHENISEFTLRKGHSGGSPETGCSEVSTTVEKDEPQNMADEFSGRIQTLFGEKDALIDLNHVLDTKKFEEEMDLRVSKGQSDTSEADNKGKSHFKVIHFTIVDFLPRCCEHTGVGQKVIVV